MKNVPRSLTLQVMVKTAHRITSQTIDRVYYEDDTFVRSLTAVCIAAPLKELRRVFNRLSLNDAKTDTQSAGDLANILCNTRGFTWRKPRKGHIDFETQVYTFCLYRGSQYIRDFRMTQRGRYVVTPVPAPKEVISVGFKSLISKSAKALQIYFPQSVAV